MTGAWWSAALFLLGMLVLPSIAFRLDERGEYSAAFACVLGAIAAVLASIVTFLAWFVLSAAEVAVGIAV